MVYEIHSGEEEGSIAKKRNIKKTSSVKKEDVFIIGLSPKALF